MDLSYGIRIRIADQSYERRFYADQKPIKTGTCTYIGLKKVINTKLPAPYSGCKDKGLHDWFMNNSVVSQQSLCFDLYKQEEINEICNCFSVDLPDVDDLEPCININEVNCKNNISIHFKVDDYIDLCPVECETVEYEFYTSFDDFPNSGSEFARLKLNPILQKLFSTSNITYEQMKSSLACFYVYFEDMKYVKISDSLVNDILSLLAGIGG